MDKPPSSSWNGTFFLGQGVKFLRLCGIPLVTLMGVCGQWLRLTTESFYAMATPPFYFANWGRQLFSVGFSSLPIVTLTCFFSGGVLALQLNQISSPVGLESLIPRLVLLGLSHELAPVLTGLMLAGRCASSMAAEIASMKTGHEIDALSCMSISPVRYLVAPRVFAALVSSPILILLGDLFGIFGGMIAASYVLDFDHQNYIMITLHHLGSTEFLYAFVKGSIFGILFSTIACTQGLISTIGAQGIGRSATMAVVISSICILSANYCLTALMT